MVGYRLGVDVGGTFTDFALVAEETGKVALYKLLTTPENPANAVIEGMVHLLKEQKIEGGDLEIVIHGTTLVANAIIERKGARVALLTTEGVRDVLHVGNENRYDINDRLLKRPSPLVPLERIHEVKERILPNGAVYRSLDTADLDRVLSEINKADIEAIAVCLLHAYRYPDHERELASILQKRMPHLPVSLSSEVAPEIREYPRTSTTVANAYVAPIVRRYLDDLTTRLRNSGYPRDLYVMLSDAGITTAKVAQEFPIRMVESGPAGGAEAAANLGRLIADDHLISFDMGGTTAKICVVDNHKPARATALEVARIHRFKRGSGLPLLLPVVELMEIGAGGGSIAWIDSLNLLKVGPESAGADPGPACYCRNGERPTVTDAALLLGYLNPEYFLGGRMTLDVEAAESAVRNSVAEHLNLNPLAAAEGIFRVATENMADAVRIYMAELGRDARNYTLVAFGGAGPMHACRIARSLRISRVVIPLGAGVTSALGFLTAPMAFEYTRSVIGELSDVDLQELETIYAAMLESSLEVLEQAGISQQAAQHTRWADMRYRAQTHEIDVELPEGSLVDGDLAEIRQRFEHRYRKLYGYTLADRAIEITRCRLRAESQRPKAFEPHLFLRQSGGKARKSQRPAYFPDVGWVENCNVYDRYALQPGDVIVGPAIVEERDATAVLDPGTRTEVGARSNLQVEILD